MVSALRAFCRKTRLVAVCERLSRQLGNLVGGEHSDNEIDVLLRKIVKEADDSGGAAIAAAGRKTLNDKSFLQALLDLLDDGAQGRFQSWTHGGDDEWEGWLPLAPNMLASTSTFSACPEEPYAAIEHILHEAHSISATPDRKLFGRLIAETVRDGNRPDGGKFGKAVELAAKSWSNGTINASAWSSLLHLIVKSGNKKDAIWEMSEETVKPSQDGRRWPTWESIEGDFLGMGELLGTTPNWSDISKRLHHAAERCKSESDGWNPGLRLARLADRFEAAAPDSNTVEIFTERLSLWKDSLLKRNHSEIAIWSDLSDAHHEDMEWLLAEHPLFTPRIDIICRAIADEWADGNRRLAEISAKAIGIDISYAANPADTPLSQAVVDGFVIAGIEDFPHSKEQAEELIHAAAWTCSFPDSSDIMNGLKFTIPSIPKPHAVDPDIVSACISDAEDMISIMRQNAGERVTEPWVRAVHSMKSISRTLHDGYASEYFKSAEEWGERLLESGRILSASESKALLDTTKTSEKALDAWKRASKSESVSFDPGTPDASPEITVQRIHSEWLPDTAFVFAVNDTLDESVFSGFVEEANELFDELDSIISSASDKDTLLAESNRILHTLKGGARLSGLNRLAEWTHRLEDLTSSGTAIPGNEIRGMMQQAVDFSRQLIPTSSLDTSETILRVAAAKLGDIDLSINEADGAEKRAAAVLGALDDAVDNMKYPMLRIHGLSEQIQNEAETWMHSGGKKRQNSQFDALEMDRFGYLHELTRKLAEAVSDTLSLRDNAAALTDKMRDAGTEAGKWLDDAREHLGKLIRTRADSISKRLSAALRTACSETGKEADIFFIGGDVNIDKRILDNLLPAFEHIVRNSAAHSIELPSDRVAKGKPRKGTVTINAGWDGDSFNFTITDDGAGFDFEAIKRKAIKNGLITPTDERTGDKLLPLIFEQGFSTTENINMVSGRGVGLDAVKETVSSLGGTIHAKSENGRALFGMKIPSGAWVFSGLVIEDEDVCVVIPSEIVKHVEIGGAEPAPGETDINVLFGLPATSNSKFRHLIRLHDGMTLSVKTSKFIENQIGKPFPKQNSENGMIGTTLLPDGRAALIISPSTLAKTLAARNAKTVVKKKENIVMVVDDSLTVRKATGKMLEKSGFDVDVSENGLVAVDKIREGLRPVAILMDIEMPIMDGFEATTLIKQMEHGKDIPVIFISSRAVDKHMSLAMEAGALTFLGKPYKENELLGILNGIRNGTIKTHEDIVAGS